MTWSIRSPLATSSCSITRCVDPPHQPQLTWQKDPHSQHVPAEFVSGRPGDGSQRRYGLADSGLEPAKFAGVGGCFPINLKGRGFIGAIAVSGMEQQEDHWLVVDTISQYLGVAVESVLPLFK